MVNSIETILEDDKTKEIQEYTKEFVFYRHLDAMSKLWLCGATNGKTQESFMALRQLAGSEKLESNISAVLNIDLASYQLEALIKSKNSERAEIVNLRDSLKAIYDSDSIDQFIRAEAAHWLARSYYKYARYNLNKAREWFSLALDTGIASTPNYSPLFQDRAWTDRGNFELQFLRLNEAKQYLEIASKLKEKKGDKYGLAINHGCLGNLYGRQGEFDKALEFYEKDLKIIKELEILKDIPTIHCKLGDLHIKQALLNDNNSLLDNSINLLNEANILVPDDRIIDKFFVYKGLAKSYLGKWWLNPESNDDKILAQKAYVKMNDLVDNSDNFYLKAINNRIAGRIKGANGNWDDSRDLLFASARCFANVGISPDLPVQEIISKIEGLRWVAYNKEENWPQKVQDNIEKLKKEIIKSGSGIKIEENFGLLSKNDIEKIHKRIKKIKPTRPIDSKLFLELNRILYPIDKLIWFFEL